MLKELIKIANDLDKQGLRKEADYLDVVIKRATPDWLGKLRGKEDLPETIEELADIVNDPSCDLACAEDAAMKYRSSTEYNDAPFEYDDAIADLIRSKQGHEA